MNLPAQRATARPTEPAVADDLDALRLGEVMAKSGFFADTRDAAQAVVKILAGRELGFGPVASMVGVYIVKGKVSLSANLIGAAIKRSGRYTYRVHELTDTACRLEFFEARESIGVSVFTMDDAKNAGLLANTTWKQYPRNMLFARAMSNGARWYAPDVFGGPIYTPEELGAPVDAEGEMVRTAPLSVLPPSTRAPAIAAQMDAEIAAVDALDEEPPPRQPVMQPEDFFKDEPAGVPGDDVDELSGLELYEACEKLRRALNAKGVEYTAIPTTRTNNALRSWWKAAAAGLATLETRA